MDGKWIAQELERVNKNQSDLARALDLLPSQVNKMIRGKRKITATEADAIKLFLQSAALPNSTLGDVIPAMGLAGALRPLEPPEGTVPVYWHRSGSDGMLHIEKRAIGVAPRAGHLRFSRHAFGLEIQADHMSPVYERRDVALINPDRAVVVGDDVLIVRSFEPLTQAPMEGYLCRLLAETADRWTVRHFTPAHDFTLPKAVWTTALHVAGKWSR